MFRPDRLQLVSSPTLAALVIVVHLLAAVAVLSSGLFIGLKVLLLGLVVWQSVRSLRQYVWLSHACSVREIRWTERSWFVRLHDGGEFEVEPAPGCRLLGWITLLRFRVLVAVDRADEEAFSSSAGAARPAVINAWLISDPSTAPAIRRLRVQLIQSCSSQN